MANRILKNPFALRDLIDENGHVVIPEGTLKIPSRAFSDCENLKSVALPTGLTSIEDGAFNGCTGLTSIELPGSLTNIGLGAFLHCTGLTSIVIPASVTTIDHIAFAECSALASIDVAPGNPNFRSEGNCLLSKDGTTLVLGCTTSVIPDSVTTIGWGAFRGCSDLSRIILPKALKVIDGYAFYHCVALTDIDLPSGVTSIGSSVFAECTGLTSLVLPDKLTSIGSHAFSECTGLVNVVIPEAVTVIKEHAFYGCASLTDVTLPDGMTRIEYYTFGCCTGLKHIEIPKGVTVIGYNAFWGCTGLESISLPDSLSAIGEGAFRDCTGLSRIVIPKSVTTIGTNAFANCTALPEDALPDGVSTVYEEFDPEDYCDEIYDIDLTEIGALVSGSKNTIINIINNAFAIFGSEKPGVGPNDDDATITLKIQEANELLEDYKAEFTLMDFLDDDNRMRAPWREYVQSCYVQSCIDEDNPNNSKGYGIALFAANETEGECSVVICFAGYDGQSEYRGVDWRDWCERMVLIYGCKIHLKRSFSNPYATGEEGSSFVSDEGIFEPNGASVKQTIIHNDAEYDPIWEPAPKPAPKPAPAPQTEDDEDLPF